MATVMVVDDDPRIHSYLNQSLSGQGHSVVEAADGQAALDELQRHDVDLMLLDLSMPRCEVSRCSASFSSVSPGLR